jgi:hypothetical protein
MFLLLPLFNRLNNIQGWLDYEEADLLICTALKACIELKAPHNIVEVGSYHGKSTVLLGTVVRSFFSKSKVYAIDPHEGVVGACGHDLQNLPPSLEMFNKNIADAGLNEVVELIKKCSFNVAWNKPISFLFIDGLHDYNNVSRDFSHFAGYVSKGGYIAFHDYISYYPGIITFVDEILKTNNYIKICNIKSLIVLQKK